MRRSIGRYRISRSRCRCSSARMRMRVSSRASRSMRAIRRRMRRSRCRTMRRSVIRSARHSRIRIRAIRRKGTMRSIRSRRRACISMSC